MPKLPKIPDFDYVDSLYVFQGRYPDANKRITSDRLIELGWEKDLHDIEVYSWKGWKLTNKYVMTDKEWRINVNGWWDWLPDQTMHSVYQLMNIFLAPEKK